MLSCMKHMLVAVFMHDAVFRHVVALKVSPVLGCLLHALTERKACIKNAPA